MRKSDTAPHHVVTVDVCVVGAGIAGISAAVESAKLGRSVALVDSLPTLGGRLVNSIVGVIFGVFGNAPENRQLTRGIFDDMIRDLEPTGAIFFGGKDTVGIGYDDVAMGRWVERTIQRHGINAITGASIIEVQWDGDRIAAVRFATRYGVVEVRATSFVDSSGDAALSWEAGLECRLPERKIYGTQQVVVENVREKHKPGPGEITAKAEALAEKYGLVRHKAVAVFTPR